MMSIAPTKEDANVSLKTSLVNKVFALEGVCETYNTAAAQLKELYRPRTVEEDGPLVERVILYIDSLTDMYAVVKGPIQQDALGVINRAAQDVSNLSKEWERDGVITTRDVEHVGEIVSEALGQVMVWYDIHGNRRKGTRHWLAGWLA